ncbi:MAG: GAF domain-containing protein, partial [Saprospiraceae bacterium]
MDFEKEIQRSKKIEAQALESCNSYPIEIPGFIQSFGALLAFDFETLSITYVSENIGEYLALEANEVLGLSVKGIFSREDFHAISNVASYNAVYTHREKVKIVELKEKEVDLSLYRIGNLIVIELTPTGQLSSTIQINSHLKWVFDAIKGLQKVEDLLKETVNALRLITGFDRAKAYIFHPDDSGEVVAESNNGKLDSYLGLRFPAYDIPPNARAIFLKVSIRYISSTSDDGVKIKTTAEHEEPLNLSLALLRGNSPIHNQYLRNMGVASSLTIPIVIKGKLWGLFAMHSKTQIRLTSEMAYSSELLGQIISMNLEQLIDRNAERKLSELRLEGDQFITLNPNPLYLDKFWSDYAENLKKLIKCNGVAYQIDEKIMTFQDCPKKETIKEISEKILEQDNKEVFHYTNIDDLQIKNTGPTRGLLALKINHSEPTIVIYFFRNEILKETAWAGNPKKDIVVENE